MQLANSGDGPHGKPQTPCKCGRASSVGPPFGKGVVNPLLNLLDFNVEFVHLPHALLWQTRASAVVAFRGHHPIFSPAATTAMHGVFWQHGAPCGLATAALAAATTGFYPSSWGCHTFFCSTGPSPTLAPTAQPVAPRPPTHPWPRQWAVVALNPIFLLPHPPRPQATKHWATPFQHPQWG